MSKSQFLSKGVFPVFLCGIFLCSLVYIPAIRFIANIDDSFSLPFSSTLIFLIGGYMAGVGAMIFLCKSFSQNYEDNAVRNDIENLSKPHWLGLSMYLPIPFLNFIVLYHYWRKSRAENASKLLENSYRKSINFQITIYLFLLLSFFLMPVVIGFLMMALSLCLHFFGTLYVALSTSKEKIEDYPINIKIAQSV